MTAVLRPVSVSDPRPSLSDAETIQLAVDANRVALCAWAARTKATVECDEWVLQAVRDALVAQKGDPIRAGRLLEMVHHWKLDVNIQWHLETIKKNYPIALTIRLLEWVLRTGIRFPAQKGDLIVFFDDSFQLRTGRVLEVHSTRATALIDGENGTKAEVIAERVNANRTQGMQIKPSLRPSHGAA